MPAASGIIAQVSLPVPIGIDWKITNAHVEHGSSSACVTDPDSTTSIFFYKLFEKKTSALENVIKNVPEPDQAAIQAEIAACRPAIGSDEDKRLTEVALRIVGTWRSRKSKWGKWGN